MPAFNHSMALAPMARLPLSSDDAYRLVVQAKAGSLAPLERLTPEYLMQLKSQLHSWSEEADVALQQVLRAESQITICRECGDKHESDHSCEDD